ncbi:MAG: 4a-hydroxytetrahydrobiopterin dehydratase [Candidatus Doudnabacteria bacterium RIFCSPHIGHO2_01_FULL_50_11]|uniref:Putative pterin-4-alpha-carbinolamine dehydratase n=1 Tax=Candidatus Doudnabacteria bacterium RIFCSPHIGHO2_01_FULL_50_11 TaxID=1817828 RepID=A0A1F5PEZ6_9BACT|nr:MAG: 4a-hydroxytetrahydrobiopterin dehydratase [Candidatus Doudnabacteria bacterium RIFCSPHIGHO2_01_FULL_50_11]
MTMQLTKKHCVPCEGGEHPLQGLSLQKYISQLHTPWEQRDGGRKIYRAFKFKDFAGAMRFANQIATIAEQEGHHPDLHVAWGKVGVELWTHVIGGLTENDFILAAKIEELQR